MGEEILEATIISLTLAGICVIIHYEALHFLHRRSLTPGNHRWLILGSVLGTLVADLTGWVTMQNRSGRSFEGARVKLMAGDVNKVSPPAAPS